jgi:hypothetical protein
MAAFVWHKMETTQQMDVVYLGAPSKDACSRNAESNAADLDFHVMFAF